MSETNTPQGELIVGTMVHGAAMNCMVVPFDNPDEWFFKQFLSSVAIEQYAAEHNLIVKWPENGTQSS